MAEYPAMPLWTDSYLADTQHLNCTESGAYLHLLICAWRSPDCRLPDNDKRLQRFARCTPSQWKKIKPAVMEFFYQGEGGFWYQKRLLKERNYLNTKRQNASNAGKASALKRNKKGSTDVGFECGHEANIEPTPIPIPIPIPPEKYKWVGRNLRLTTQDFQRWKENYSNIPDLVAELNLCDDYYSEHPREDQKYFHCFSRWLKRAHDQNPKVISLKQKSKKKRSEWARLTHQHDSLKDQDFTYLDDPKHHAEKHFKMLSQEEGVAPTKERFKSWWRKNKAEFLSNWELEIEYTGN